MIGYATLGTNDIAKARGFYDALLGVVGAKRIMQYADDVGGGFTLWGTSSETPSVAVTRPHNNQQATVGNGSMLALKVDQRAVVEVLHAKAVELGGTCDGPAELRSEEGPQAIYAPYFRDLDGNKLCAFRMGPAS